MARKWLVHYIAECTVCGWGTEDYINGQKKASQHATRTGHLVKAEAGYAVEYGNKTVSNKGEK